MVGKGLHRRRHIQIEASKGPVFVNMFEGPAKSILLCQGAAPSEGIDGTQHQIEI